MHKLNKDEIVDTFLDHVRYLRVKHHVPGRIRVKATWSGAKKLAGSADADIEKIIAMIPGVQDYRVNPKALSVVVSYDPMVLPYRLWEDIGRLGEYPTNRQQVRKELLELVGEAENKEA